MKTSETTAPDWEEIRAKLAEPFPAEDVEWRVSRAGSKKDGAPWCLVLAYINNRAVQDRLDDAVGIEGWEDAFMPGPQGGIMCGISIYGVTKYDGAENTKVDPVKGGFSDSEKRAAVKWGIGRYLYNLTENFAEISTSKRKGWNWVKEKTDAKYPSGNHAEFYWLPPILPAWALPEGTPPMAPPLPKPPGNKEVDTADPATLSRTQLKKRAAKYKDRMYDVEKEKFNALYEDADTAGLAGLVTVVENRMAREGT